MVRAPLIWRPWLLGALLTLVIHHFTGVAGAEDRFIRLRNATIRTPDPVRGAARLQNREPAVSGLYLIQFAATPAIEARDAVEGLGIELLAYVPDDAFIARLRNVELATLRSLPSVRWVGEYRAELKVAARLRELAGAGLPADIGISVSPRATPQERVLLRRTLQRLERESSSRFGIAVRGRATPAQLAVLAASPVVLWIEPAPRHRLFDEIATKLVAGGSYETGEPGGDFPPIGGGGDDGDDDTGGGLAGITRPRVRPAGLPSSEHQAATHQLGFDGRGVTVAVADSGLDSGDTGTMHPDLRGRVDGFFFYGALRDASDEHGHGTHVSGIVAGDGSTGETDEFGNLFGLGVAPNAHIVMQRIFDGAGGYEAPPTYETLTRDAVRAGAVIGSNSWGDDTQGRYDISAAEFDALVRDADSLAAGEQGYILEFSAGNAGPGAQTIGSPAVAKNVIASGAAENDRYGFFLYEDGPDAMADFSSRGPCEDGRIKPDVVAPGTWIASLQSQAATDENAWSPISANYQYEGGTSQSGPHVSGAAAILVQYWRETHGGATPSPALTKALLINSATDMDDEAGGTEPVPNFDEGWGRVTLTNIIGSARKLEFVDQSVSLTNQQVFERKVLIGNPRFPLKVTLTYTDVPALPAAVPALVNDLDLEVIGPDGTSYRGNAFVDGESVPNALAADFINNVEGVHLGAPQPGEYVVRVRGTRIVQDIHARAGVAPVQDFALVVTADLPLPGQGVLVLDRVAYSAPANVAVRLIDFDVRGAASVPVKVTSIHEPAGETLILLPLGGSGVFTGMVATVTGPPAADGRLQVAHGDTLTVSYDDASPAGVRSIDAEVDLLPPLLQQVSGGTRFGRLLINWQTDEDSTSVVEYGPTEALGSVLTNGVLVTEHSIALGGFSAKQKVYYRVRSVDAAGNQSSADDGGRPFVTEVAATAPVLLVDQYNDMILSDSVPVTTYTDALDAVGVAYEVWDVLSEGRAPKFEELRSYPVVIWRVGEFFNDLDAANVKALRDYVDAGGGLFMASMELLSRLDEKGFTNFRKNVLHVEDYDVDPGVPGVYGSDSLSMTSGIETDTDFSEYPDLFFIPSDLSDTFRPATNSLPILFDSSTGKPVGVRWPATGQDGVGRVVFFSFPFDTIPFDGPPPSNRPEVLRRVLSFLSPGLGGLSTLELDREEYTLPALATVEVTDATRAGQGTVTVKIRTEREGVDQLFELAATGRRGQFRGIFKLVPEAEAAGPGLVRARDGDVLLLNYEGVPPAEAVSVAALVDTGVPKITEVTVEPDYNEAVVRWNTSEPTDGLVKYDDVGFPSNFTAYHPDFSEEHELHIVGLEPDHEYEFVVVSRDPAGNTAEDDNAGKRYHFRTLKPLTPPFTDDLEHGGTNWTVGGGSADAETLSLLVSSSWELGKPANALATAAHSGNACWGTNLGGDVNDYSESSLVSPAILLAGGNRATLRFWHNYDFVPRSDEGDIAEVGGVYITTNNGAAWNPIREYDEASDGWEPEEIDLTSFLGQTIRLGWAYGLFSFASVEHPGWLVDDIAVTVETFVPVSITLSNNLSQASVAITGPRSSVEKGSLVVLTNMPPGEYHFQFGDVPYYVTPQPQTNLLAGGGSALVAGRYTFPDTNADGISDLWEQRFLGGVQAGHRATDDTDDDGFDDQKEFLAGTNPTNAVSRLVLLVPQPQPIAGADVTLRWETAQGYSYRILGSPDAISWAPVTGWLRAGSSALQTTVPVPTSGAPYLFRLEASP